MRKTDGPRKLRAAVALWMVCPVVTPIGAVSALAQGANDANRMADDQYVFATELFGKQLYELSIQQYEKFLTDFPNHPKRHQARLRIGEAYLRLNQYDKALQSYQTALDQKPDSIFRIEALTGLGLAHFQLKGFPKAVEILTEATDLAEKDAKDNKVVGPIAATWLGESYFQMMKYDEAIAAYQRVAKWPGNDQEPVALYSVGFCQAAKGQQEQAVATYLQVVEKYHNKNVKVAGEASFRAAEGLVQLKKYPEAGKQYEALIKNFPASEFRPAAQLGIGWIAFMQKDYPKARAAYQAVLTNYADSPAVPEAKKRVADCYYHEKNYAEAAAGYIELTKSADKTVAREATYWLAHCRIYQGQKDEAAQLLTSIGQDKEAGALAVRSRLRLGDLRLEMEDAKAAADEYRAALGLLSGKPEDAAALEQATYGLGIAQYRQGQFAEAEGQFAAIIARSPGGAVAPLAVVALAQCRLDRKDAAGAVTQLDELLKRPELAEETRRTALMVRAQALDAGDKADEAGAAYRDLFTKYPDSPQAPVAASNLATLLRRTNKAKEAAEVEQLLLTKYGEAPQAIDALLGTADSERLAGNLEGAVALYAQLAKRKLSVPQQQNLNAGLAVCYALQKKPELAAQHLKAFADTKPEAPFMGRVQLLLARAYEQTERLDDAIVAYRAVLAGNPDEETAASALHHMGMALASQKKPMEALTAFNEAIQKYPKAKVIPEAIYEMAWVYLDASDRQHAMELFARLEKEYPELDLAADASFRLAEEDFKAKDWAKAAPRYRKVLAAKNPGDLGDKAAYRLGWCTREQKQWAASAEAFLTVVTRFPKSDLVVESRVYGAEALYNSEQFKPAMEQFRVILASGVQSQDDQWMIVYSRVALGRLYLRNNDAQAAIATLKPATGTANGTWGGEAQLLLADGLLLQKDYKNALVEYLKVVRLYPSMRAHCAQAQYRVGECFEQLKDSKNAVQAYRDVIADHPTSEWTQHAKSALTRLGIK